MRWASRTVPGSRSADRRLATPGVGPSRRFECDVIAWLGDSLEKPHRKLAGIRRRPDAVIIYSGHNEFVARFEKAARNATPGSPRSRGIAGCARLTAPPVLPSCRLAYEIISKNRLDEPPMAGRHQLIDPPLCSPSEAADILADFRPSEAIVAYCERIGALPILIVPPANESGSSPAGPRSRPGVASPTGDG